jgi:AbiV family abortive infection protein
VGWPIGHVAGTFVGHLGLACLRAYLAPPLVGMSLEYGSSLGTRVVKVGSYPQIPPSEDLLALFRAAMSNAEDLLDDAQALADAGRFPRAFSLAILAWEELSKGQLCLLATVLDEITRQEFWDRFRDHESKLGRVHAIASIMRPEPIPPLAEHVKAIMGQSRSTNNLKFRGFYVDYRRGKILLPSQIGKAAARKKIKEVRDALAYANAAFSVDSLDESIAQTRALARDVKDAFHSDPDRMAAALQQAMHSGSQEDLEALILGITDIPRDIDSPPSA